MHHTIDDLGMVLVCGCLACLKAATLVDGNINHDSAGFHALDQFAGN